MRAFRELDRRLNVYPQLHYPEVYLLYKGFKNFFAEYPVRLAGVVRVVKDATVMSWLCVPV
jgi:hypothetical protein